jgi:hypothetical protein
MTTINDLCFNQTPALSDQIALYSSASGITQRTSLNLLFAALAQLSTVQPVAGSGDLWIDKTAGNVIKVAL